MGLFRKKKGRADESAGDPRLAAALSGEPVPSATRTNGPMGDEPTVTTHTTRMTQTAYMSQGHDGQDWREQRAGEAAVAGFQIPPGARVISSSTTINGQPASPDQVHAVESLIGMDLDGDGIVGPPAN